MKKLTFLAAGLFAATLAMAQGGLLTLTPAQAKAGETIRFVYDIQHSPLQQSPDAIEALAAEYSDQKLTDVPVMIRFENGKLTGSFQLSAGAEVAVLNFKSGERWDNNAGEGYFINLYDASGKVKPQSLAAQAVVYKDWGGLFELNRKSTVAFDLLQKAIAAKPELKKEYFSAYISNVQSIKRGEEGKTEALALLDQLSQATDMPEKEQIALLRWQERLAGPDKANTLREQIRRKFPKGTFVRQERRQTMRNEPDLAKYQALAQAYEKDFPATTDAEKSELNEVYQTLANKAFEKKDWALLKSTAVKLLPASRASLYNNVSWEMAESGEELDMARQMASEATSWTKQEVMAPTQEKPSYLSDKAWEESRKDQFAQYADTYAYVLDKSGDSESAVAYQAQVVEITKGTNLEMNERYTEFLEKTKAPDLRYRLEGFILKGQASDKMKEQFKGLYASEDQSAAGTEAYLAGLEKVAKAARKKEIAGKMLNQEAPKFSLKNLDGEEVSLEGLKGKVVIVDFWATWCGPCKASFPGMQKTQADFQNDPNVRFVFVDAWERVPDRAKIAGDFIKSKNYPFNVLLDQDDSVITAFGVSGIPTKFIIDKNGRIRFKSVGYPGTSEALVDELTAMIELVKEQP